MTEYNYDSEKDRYFSHKYREELLSERRRKILTKQKDLRWEKSRQAGRRAWLIDRSIGFGNAVISTFIGGISAGGQSGKHEHNEACIYILNDKGYSIIGDNRYDWEEGDSIYIPPNTDHQHFNLDKEKTVRYLAAIPEALSQYLGIHHYKQKETNLSYSK